MLPFAQVTRRCLAVVGMLALALVYLPGAVCLLNAAPACCSATMCPMHNTAGSHMTCGMDMTHPGSVLQTCGCHSVQFTGGFVFNRVVPPLVHNERVAGAAPVLPQVAFAGLVLEVVSPPPRLSLS